MIYRASVVWTFFGPARPSGPACVGLLGDAQLRPWLRRGLPFWPVTLLAEGTAITLLRSCLPFGSAAWVPLPDWPDPCWSGWAHPFGFAAVAAGLSLARDRHIVGEPMCAYEAGQELLCHDAGGPALHG